MVQQTFTAARDSDMIYKALGLYWGGFTWTQGHAESTNTVSAELVCSWARVKSSHEGRRSLGQRSKAFSVFLLSHQSQNSADPTYRGPVHHWRYMMAIKKNYSFRMQSFLARAYKLQMVNHTVYTVDVKSVAPPSANQWLTLRMNGECRQRTSPGIDAL